MASTLMHRPLWKKVIIGLSKNLPIPSSVRPRAIDVIAEVRRNWWRRYNTKTRSSDYGREKTDEDEVNPYSTSTALESYSWVNDYIEKSEESKKSVEESKVKLETDVDEPESSETDTKKANEESELLEDFEQHPGPRPPRAVQAAYLRPLRREAVYNIPVCDLQLRSYSVRNLEFMADFALRAAYFLDLPASGPVPLPRIIERWTVPKAHFIHKKVQENFERKTLRRLIQIKDGDSEVVRLWLGFLRKHAYYGVGMKANVWEFAGIDVAKDMDAALKQNRPEIEPLLAQYAFKEGSKYGEKIVEIANRENRWQASGGGAPMISTPDWRKPLN